MNINTYKLKRIVKRISNFVLTPFILKDYLLFKKMADNRFYLKLINSYPQIKDKTVKTGFDRHYIYHTAWAARKIAELKPSLHTDISSSLYFSSIVSAFVPVNFFDYRPADLQLDNLTSAKADLMNLPFHDKSINSLSCMHVVEHIGLGRYGDPIDPKGDLKAINELKRVVSVGGSLLFVVPVGKPKIEFNAHRIYSYEQIISYFSEFQLEEYVLIPEHSGPMIYNASKELTDLEHYGCGCFWFKKK
jgi:hypothetical protein